jgi:hypothetical protein
MLDLPPQRGRLLRCAAICAPAPRRTRPARPRLAGRVLPLLALALVALALSAPAALAGPRLPAMGVPFPALLRADPALGGGLQLAGLVRRAGTARAAAPLPAALARRVGSIVQVRPGRGILVHRSPGGPVVEALDDRSDSGGQPRAFTVYRLGSPGWLGVSVPALRGHLGWVHVEAGTLAARPALEEIHVSLHRRSLTLLRGGRLAMRTSVVIGAPSSPTPVGHFSVDDKLRYTPASAEYGIGVLALSVPPSGRAWQQWRVAIHGLNNLGRLGGSGSLGCVHVPARELARLLRSVPVGTPVDITA